MSKLNLENEKYYYFFLKCYSYEKEGLFRLLKERAKYIRLNPDLLETRFPGYGLSKDLKNLQDFLSSNESKDWSWESHSPFDLSSFYEHAELLLDYNNEEIFYVSE